MVSTWIGGPDTLVCFSFLFLHLQLLYKVSCDVGNPCKMQFFYSLLSVTDLFGRYELCTQILVQIHVKDNWKYV